MSVIFECEYEGERFAGIGQPAPGAPQTLYRVADGQLRSTLIRLGLAGLVDAISASTDRITIAADDPGLRFLPPLLPSITGNALVSGFMRTHKSKFESEPRPGEAYVPANWFVKGFGSWLRLPGDPLVTPEKPVALIEEPEVVLVYVNDEDGNPRYAGHTFGNDLCDIGLHIQNPAWNPYCKLCDTAVAPWLFPEEPPKSATGQVTIARNGVTAWEGTFDCGADALYFPVPDMVDHLFGYPALRRPGMVNYVFLGADKASYHDGFRITDGDQVTIDVKSHGVLLSNVVQFGARAS